MDVGPEKEITVDEMIKVPTYSSKAWFYAKV